MLQNTRVSVFDGRPEFSREFIRSKKIKSISGSFSTKATSDMMRESKEFVYYKFNQYGELTFEYRTLLGDTLFILYVWDERSNLIIKRSANKYGFESRHYRYDHKNRVIYSELRTCTSNGENRWTYIPDEDKKISSEKFEYVDLDEKSYKKNYLNNSGVVYKEEFFYFNDRGQLIEQTGFQKIGSGKTSAHFFYDNAGKIVQKKSENTVMGFYADRYEYEYDSSANIFAMKYYENGVYKTEFQFVYDSDNIMLKALIMRDITTEVMTIIKYDNYSYY